jgi:hypothetical protein
MSQLRDAVSAFVMGLLVGIFGYWLTQGSHPARVINKAIGVVLKAAGDQLATEPQPKEGKPAAPGASEPADEAEGARD